jgi:hypothetical protein
MIAGGVAADVIQGPRGSQEHQFWKLTGGDDADVSGAFVTFDQPGFV